MEWWGFCLFIGWSDFGNMALFGFVLRRLCVNQNNFVNQIESFIIFALVLFNWNVICLIYAIQIESCNHTMQW